MSFQQIQKYELGKDRISASQLLSIAHTLEKDMSFFFEDVPDSLDDNGTEALPERVLGRMPRNTTAYDIKIIRMLHAIEDERVKMRLFGLMEAIVGADRADDLAEGPAPSEGWLNGRFG